ncbi:hypothetical protein LXL04_006595 [Taraxacum kok-saghyz]
MARSSILTSPYLPFSLSSITHLNQNSREGTNPNRRATSNRESSVQSFSPSIFQPSNPELSIETCFLPPVTCAIVLNQVEYARFMLYRFESNEIDSPYLSSCYRFIFKAVEKSETKSPRFISNIPSFGIAFDIDGVILRGRCLKIPYLFLTNGGGIPESRRASELSQLLGVNIDPIQVVQGHSPFKNLLKRYFWNSERAAWESCYCRCSARGVSFFGGGGKGNFYSDIVNDQITLLQLLGTKTHNIPDDSGIPIEPSDESEYIVTPSQKRAGRWARMNYKIVLSYQGASFDGWQTQPDLNTVQAVIEKCLGKFVDERKAALLKGKGLPLKADAVVAGRTDKGVTDTWREDIKPLDIQDAINSTVPGKLRVICSDHQENNIIGDNNSDDVANIEKPTKFKVSKVNKLLQQLERKLLSYKNTNWERKKHGFRQLITNVNPDNIQVCSGPDLLPVNPSKCALLSKLGQPAWLSRFGHFKGQISQSVKDKEDRSHDTLTIVKILASNSKESRRYESRKTTNEQRNYRLLRSRTEMAVISKP